MPSTSTLSRPRGLALASILVAAALPSPSRSSAQPAAGPVCIFEWLASDPAGHVLRVFEVVEPPDPSLPKPRHPVSELRDEEGRLLLASPPPRTCTTDAPPWGLLRCHLAGAGPPPVDLDMVLIGTWSWPPAPQAR